MDFPRKVSTRTTGGRQVLVNDRPQALARFDQANWLDCRVSAYTELDDSPNFLFIDVDTLDSSVLEEILQRFEELNWKPTVLFTGSGHHIYQPVSIIDFSTKSNFNGYSELPKQFLRFVAEYLADNKADVNHNPSLKSCMVRVPGSVNSKNGLEVRIIKEWDGNRPDITSLLGIFYSWLATRKIISEKSQRPISKFRADKSSSKINWIEVLLKTPLDDYRKTIVNLVLAPYLVNVRKLDYEASFTIIRQWLDLCSSSRKLCFVADSLTSNALATASKTGYKI